LSLSLQEEALAVLASEQLLALAVLASEQLPSATLVALAWWTVLSLQEAALAVVVLAAVQLPSALAVLLDEQLSPAIAALLTANRPAATKRENFIIRLLRFI
jgi:hypothetical protein